MKKKQNLKYKTAGNNKGIRSVYSTKKLVLYVYTTRSIVATTKFSECCDCFIKILFHPNIENH